MFKHYFIVAFRNLLKYKQQTIISLIGLTVGFVCFALSAYWIRYEMSFDAFHSRADQIYQVRQIEENHQIGLTTPLPLAERLESLFPEIKATCTDASTFDLDTIEGAPRVRAMRIDNRFFELFDVEFIQGSFDINDASGVWVTDRFAREYFKNEHPVGQELVWYGDWTGKVRSYRVRGVVKEWPRNTNLWFDVLLPVDREALDRYGWGARMARTYVQIADAGRAEALHEKFLGLQLKEVVNSGTGTPNTYTLVPLCKAYYTAPEDNDSRLLFNQVVLFAVLGLLVVVCSLFNYLNLYASRIRMRTRELSLRKVNGASDRQLFGMLIVEFGLLLLFALGAGFLCVEWLLPDFKAFADIESDRLSIYGELFLYVLVLVAISLLSALLVVVYVRRRVFQESLRRVASAKAGGLLGRTGLLLQMVIGVGFIFCVVIYFKQIHTLNTASGMERENILWVFLAPHGNNGKGGNEDDIKMLANALRGESSVEAVLTDPDSYTELLAKVNENVTDEEAVRIMEFQVNPDYLGFYGLKLLAGVHFDPNIRGGNQISVIVNEAAVKALGLTDPVGKIFYDDVPPYYTSDGKKGKYNYTPRSCKIIGVVKDFVYDSPLVSVPPVMLTCVDSYKALAVKCRPGQLSQVEEIINRLTSEKFPGQVARVSVLEQTYRDRFEQETSLRFLLALLSGVCIIVSLFGIYSMVSLASEQRRKEMAVRKVNGASIVTILGLFLKEYLLLLLISIAVVYPVGYLIMRPWLEKFVLQTSVGIWLYISFFVCVALVIVLTVIARVWRTAHVSPVTELKKE